MSLSMQTLCNHTFLRLWRFVFSSCRVVCPSSSSSVLSPDGVSINVQMHYCNVKYIQAVPMWRRNIIMFWLFNLKMIFSWLFSKLPEYFLTFTAAAQIAYPIKFPNFLTKLIKVPSQLDWNIHVHRLSAWTASLSITCRGIGTAVMRNVTAHSILLQSKFS